MEIKPDASASEMEQALRNMGSSQKESVEKKEEEKVAPVPPAANPLKEEKKEEIKEEAKEDKSDYDYRKGYEGLRSWVTRISQDVAETKKAVLETKASPKEEKQPEWTREQLLDWQAQDPIAFGQWIARQEAEARVSEVKKELNAVKAGLGQFYGRQIVDDFRSKYSDFKALELEIKEELANLPPELTENPAYYDKALDIGYWKVKGKKTKEVAEKEREAGRKEAEKKEEDLKKSFVEGSGKVAPEEPFDMSKMDSKALFAEMKARGLVKE